MDDLAVHLTALENDVRTMAERARATAEEIRALRVKSEQDSAEIAKLRSAVVRLDKHLQSVAEEGQKTGAALYERIEALRKT